MKLSIIIVILPTDRPEKFSRLPVQQKIKQPLTNIENNDLLKVYFLSVLCSIHTSFVEKRFLLMYI